VALVDDLAGVAEARAAAGREDDAGRDAARGEERKGPRAEDRPDGSVRHGGLPTMRRRTGVPARPRGFPRPRAGMKKAHKGGKKA
jgi:hypothetical protein